MKKYIKLGATIAAAVVMLAGCGNNGGTSATSATTEAPTSTSETPAIIDVQSVALDKQTLDLYIGDSVFLRATVLPENASVKTLNWTSSNDEVAMVAANGKVIGLAVGTATIRCESVSNPAKFSECVVTVTKKDTTIHVTDITLNKSSADLYTNESLQLNASVLPENATNKKINWASSDPAIAYVSSDGKVYASAVGTAVITASSDEKPEIKKTCTLTITKKDTTVHVETVTIEDELVELDLGGTVVYDLEATVLPENATNKALRWTSSDPAKVSVDSANGTIRALAVTTESVTITATSVQDPEVSDTVLVKVDDTRDPEIHVTGVSVKESETLDLKGSPTKTLIATITPPHAWNKNVTWESDDPSVVTVDEETGLLTAVSVGTANVTVTTEDGGFSDTCIVTVIDSTIHVNSVVIKQDGVAIDDADITLNGFISLSAEALAVEGEPDEKGITWQLLGEGSSDYIGLTVSGENALLTGKVATTSPITLRATSVENSEIYKDISVTVTDPTVYPDHISISVGGVEVTETSIELNKSISLTGTVYPLDATEKGITWSIFTSGGSEFIILGGDEGETISVLGKKLTGADQKITVRATAKGDENVYKDIDITVIDPSDVTKFVNFVMPASITLYDIATKETNLNSVAGLATNENIDVKYFNYDGAEKARLNYKVGDQGVFTYNPSAKVRLPGESEDTDVANPSTIKTLYMLNDSTWEEVTMADYCTIDSNGIDYTFKSAAVGHHFKLSLLPDPSKYYSRTPIPFDFEFDVVHGYNVDSLAELSLFDNYQSVWSDYKTASGLAGVTAQGGLVLHKNIQIVGSILPQKFIWTKAEVDNYLSSYNDDFIEWYQYVGYGVYGENAYEEAYNAFVNSAKDYSNVFHHVTQNGEGAFNIHGNTFSIDASQMSGVAFIDYHDDLPHGMKKGWDGDGSHAQLFTINNEIHNAFADSDTLSFNNLTIIGNSTAKVAYPSFITEMPEGAAKKTKKLAWDSFITNRGKGGYIIHKNDHTYTTFNNTIIHDAFISLYDQNVTRSDNRGLHVDRTFAYDTYSNSMYLFGGYGNTVTNSWFTRAGGPLLLMDEHQPRGATHLNKCSADFDNCYLNNPVTSTASWFAMHNASALIEGNIITPGLTPTSETEVGTKWVGAMMAQVPGSRKISRVNESGQGECNFIALTMCIGALGRDDSPSPEIPYGNRILQQSSMYINHGSQALDFDMARTEIDGTTMSTAALLERSMTFISPCFFESSLNGCFGAGLNYMDPKGTQAFYDNPANAFFGDYDAMYMNFDQGFEYGLQYIGLVLKTY